MKIEHLKRAEELYRNQGSITREEIAQMCGISEYESKLVRSVIINQNILQDFINNTSPETNVYKEETGNSQIIVVKSNEIETPDELLKDQNVDLSIWEVVKSKIELRPNDKWNAVSVWLKKKENEANLLSILKEFREEAEHHAPEYEPIKHGHGADCILEVSIPDFHFGSLVWQKETRDFNYDIKIARRLYLNCVDYLLGHAISHNPEKILFLVGSDFLNSDNLENTTTSGTPQAEDCRWQKTFSEAWKLVIAAIDKCREIAPVDAVVIAGNHDRQRSFYLGETIAAWYSKCEDVTVDNEPTSRKYYEYGSNLIGLTHGMEKKIDELPLIMANEAKDAWSRTTFRTWHIGHKHFRKKMIFTPIDERQAVRIEQVSSLASTDDWHSRSGYNSIKEASAYIWDKYKGQTACYNFHPTEEDYNG